MNYDEVMARLDGLIKTLESSLGELKDAIAETKRHLAAREDVGVRFQTDLDELEGMTEQAKRELAHFRLFRKAMTTGQYPGLDFAQVWDLTRTEAGATLH
jgi:hypothetical protein